MQSIKDAMGNLKLPDDILKAAEEHKQRVVNDQEIRDFIERNQLTHEQIVSYFSVFSNFVTNKHSKKSVPQILIYQDGVVDCADVKTGAELQRAIDKVSTSFVTSGQTQRLKGLSFNDALIDEYNERIITAFKRLTSNYEYKGNKVGVWLHGKFGRGKTYLLGVLANELHRKGAGVTYVTPNDFINGAHSVMSQRKSLDAYINEFANYEVLILDDLGTEHLSEFSVKVLYELMAKRYDRDKLTFASSNLTIDEYIGFIKTKTANPMDAERLQERLRLLCTQIKLDGENRRV